MMTFATEMKCDASTMWLLADEQEKLMVRFPTSSCYESHAALGPCHCPFHLCMVDSQLQSVRHRYGRGSTTGALLVKPNHQFTGCASTLQCNYCMRYNCPGKH